jgi:hypothetical protein
VRSDRGECAICDSERYGAGSARDVPAHKDARCRRLLRGIRLVEGASRALLELAAELLRE